MPQEITVHGFTVDAASLPASSVVALIHKGLTHYLGNEVASRVTAAKIKAEAAGEAFDAEATTRTLRDEYFSRVTAGTMGETGTRLALRGIDWFIDAKGKEAWTAIARKTGYGTAVPPAFPAGLKWSRPANAADHRARVDALMAASPRFKAAVEAAADKAHKASLKEKPLDISDLL